MNKNYFCNTPWYELHIYWDGSLGICCQEDHKLYDTDKQYNIKNTTIAEWFNSEPVRQFRLAVMGDHSVSACRQCYLEEAHGAISRRIRSNQKSVIFTTQAFDVSVVQSPGYHHFMHSEKNSGEALTHPIDLHIDLGNYCNLACKMCGAHASTTIASQEVRWGIENSRQYLGVDWTADKKVWNSFKQQLVKIPGLNNIHFMGGETLLTDRIEDLVDTMIEHQRFDICFSFVTNGTVYRPELIKKLSKFRRVGIEISIETVDEHNAYQRQGTDTDLVLKNIDRYLDLCNGTTVTVSLRPAPSALSIGYHVGLLEYALEKKLIVKSNLCYSPRFLAAEILPTSVKKQYARDYQRFLSQFDQSVSRDINASDPNNYQAVIQQHATMCLDILKTPTPEDSKQSLAEMVAHCRKWDQVYDLDARQLYPEWKQILDEYGY